MSRGSLDGSSGFAAEGARVAGNALDLCGRCFVVEGLAEPCARPPRLA
jgi:hypothetical protein